MAGLNFTFLKFLELSDIVDRKFIELQDSEARRPIKENREKSERLSTSSISKMRRGKKRRSRKQSGRSIESHSGANPLVRFLIVLYGSQAAGKGVDWAQKRTEPKHTFLGPE